MANGISITVEDDSQQREKTAEELKKKDAEYKEKDQQD